MPCKFSAEFKSFFTVTLFNMHSLAEFGSLLHPHTDREGVASQYSQSWNEGNENVLAVQEITLKIDRLSCSPILFDPIHEEKGRPEHPDRPHFIFAFNQAANLGCGPSLS